MLRKLNCFLNIVIGSFIGVFIGYGIYKFWHFKTYREHPKVCVNLQTDVR